MLGLRICELKGELKVLSFNELKLRLKNDETRTKTEVIKEYIDYDSYKEMVALYTNLCKKDNIKYDLIYSVINLLKANLDRSLECFQFRNLEEEQQRKTRELLIKENDETIKTIISFVLEEYKLEYSKIKRSKAKKLNKINEIINNKELVDKDIVDIFCNHFNELDKVMQKEQIKLFLNEDILNLDKKHEILSKICLCKECFNISYIDHLLEQKQILNHSNVVKYVETLSKLDDLEKTNLFTHIPINKELKEKGLCFEVLDAITKAIPESQEVLFDMDMYRNLETQDIRKVLRFSTYFNKEALEYFINEVCLNDNETEKEKYDILYNYLCGWPNLKEIQKFIKSVINISNPDSIQLLSKFLNNNFIAVEHIRNITIALKDDSNKELEKYYDYLCIYEKKVINLEEVKEYKKSINY